MIDIFSVAEEWPPTRGSQCRCPERRLVYGCVTQCFVVVKRIAAASAGHHVNQSDHRPLFVYAMNHVKQNARRREGRLSSPRRALGCLLYTSDAADE